MSINYNLRHSVCWVYRKCRGTRTVHARVGHAQSCTVIAVMARAHGQCAGQLRRVFLASLSPLRLMLSKRPLEIILHLKFYSALHFGIEHSIFFTRRSRGGFPSQTNESQLDSSSIETRAQQHTT